MKIKIAKFVLVTLMFAALIFSFMLKTGRPALDFEVPLAALTAFVAAVRRLEPAG